MIAWPWHFTIAPLPPVITSDRARRILIRLRNKARRTVDHEKSDYYRLSARAELAAYESALDIFLRSLPPRGGR